jgi:hypothetical protein
MRTRCASADALHALYARASGYLAPCTHAFQVEGELPRWAVLSWYWTPAPACPQNFSPVGFCFLKPKKKKLETINLKTFLLGGWVAGHSGWSLSLRLRLCAPHALQLHLLLCCALHALGFFAFVRLGLWLLAKRLF